MRCPIAKNMFMNFSSIILHDDVLEGLVGEGCSNAEGSVRFFGRVIIGLLKKVGFGVSFSIEVCIEIH